MNCTKESIWYNLILKFTLLTFFYLLIVKGGIGQGNSTEGTWQLKLDVDNYFSIREAWASEGNSVSIVVYDSNEVKQYALSMITIADEWNHFNFPEDFVALSDQSKNAELTPQNLIFEVRVKRNIEKRETFFFDPSPNAFLQLNIYTFSEKLDESLVWGNFIDAYSWEDKNGENVVVRSELIFDASDDSLNEFKKYLYLYHFIHEDENLKLIRKFTDVYSGCVHPPNASFSLPSIELTDIDRDTVGEINTIYDLYCSGGDTTIYHSKLLMTSYGNKFMLDAEIDPCEEGEERIVKISQSSSFKFYPYLLRYMQQKLGEYQRL